jgi:ATP-dependent DNA ligase
MLAKNFSKPFSHRDWLFDVKWDGFRAIAYVKKDFNLRSRNDNEPKRNFPEIQELRRLAKDVVVDGDLVVMKDGLLIFKQCKKEQKQPTSGPSKNYRLRAQQHMLCLTFYRKMVKTLLVYRYLSAKKS